MRQFRQAVVALDLERFFRVGRRRVATRLRLKRQELRFRVQREFFLRTQRAQPRQVFLLPPPFLKFAKLTSVRMRITGARRVAFVVTMCVVITYERIVFRRIPNGNLDGSRGASSVNRVDFLLINRLNCLTCVVTFPTLRLKLGRFGGVARIFATIIVPSGGDRRVVGFAERSIGRRSSVLRGANGGVVRVGNVVERLQQRDVARQINRLAVERRERNFGNRQVAQNVPIALRANA